MSNALRWRTAGLAALVILFTYLAGANLVPKEQRLESGFWPNDGLRLGLDLQGGIHWVLGVEIDAAVKHELEFVADNIRASVEEDGIAPARLEVVAGELIVEAAKVEDSDALAKAANVSNVLRETGSEGLITRYALTDAWTQEIRERTMSQVLEVLRRRITDPATGIPESVVTRQGDDRVLVQIPGGQIDRSSAHKILKSTGFLEFKIARDQARDELDETSVEVLSKRHDQLVLTEEGGREIWKGGGDMIVTEEDPETHRIIAAYLVGEQADLTGEYLEDARVGFDPQQRPIVNFRFNPEGGRLFGELTEAHLKEPLAIVLDHNVYSAPIIQSQITTRGQITGRFTNQEAADLAVVLRAGALSVPVIIEEERTVGPTLGQDSIDAGTRASLLGLLVIVLFSIAYYKLSGLYASLALFINLVLLVGVMSFFTATLTLPGIAGLVLTVGMAIDANVIIFERIREELRVGKTPRAAIATGFNKALWTVLDANITTLITAIVLFEFGTGPIKGFAVTLSIGIVTSVFAALVVTRTLLELYPGSRSVQQLSI